MPLVLFPTFVMAVLSSWLGLSLLGRAPRDPATQAFAWLCLHLTLYALSIALAGMSGVPAVRLTLERVQVVETVLLPPVWLHFIMVFTRVRRARAAQRWMLLGAYALGLAMALYALLSPAMLVVNEHVRFPPGLLAVLWTVHRAVPLLLSLVLVAASYQTARGDELERRRRGLFALAACTGVVGALWSTLARETGSPLAWSHLLWDAALVLMAYAVLAYRLLLPARVAQRAFYRSLLGSAMTAAYIGGLLLLEPWVGATLAISTPVVSVFAVVLLIALFGPVRDWAGAWLDRRFFHREFDYGQMLRAFSQDLLERGDLADQLEAALAAICQTLGVPSGMVLAQEGTGLRALARYGKVQIDDDLARQADVPEAPETRLDNWQPWPYARLLLPLRLGEQALGLLVLSRKRSGALYNDTERELLDSLSRYLALAIRHARKQQEYELELAAVTEQGRQLRAMEALLTTQIAEVKEHATVPAPPTAGLRVYALGPLRVERDGSPIDRWGGDKAGSKQAEALFAFLFDRCGKGLTKDEAEEVIWPDLELDKADMSFHRTLSALRRTLEPGLRRGNQSRTITYHHERYWLDPAAVGWSDVGAFQAAVERGHTLLRQGDLEAAREHFQQAVVLYRGEYMDDCPLFGDSSYVEDRRAELRDQQIGVLVALGGLYEQLDQVGEAATCYRRAISTSLDGCPRAEEGLARLHAVQR